MTNVINFPPLPENSWEEYKRIIRREAEERGENADRHAAFVIECMENTLPETVQAKGATIKLELAQESYTREQVAEIVHDACQSIGAQLRPMITELSGMVALTLFEFQSS